MDAQHQLWAFWVQVAGTVGTFLAVLVALFGERLRAAMFQPRLTLTLQSPVGHGTPADIEDAGKTIHEQARYYHVELANLRKWPKATQAQIYLIRIDEDGPDSSPQTRWSGAVPLSWQWQALNELRRTIGPPAVADLACLVRNRGFALTTLIIPSSAERWIKRPWGRPFSMTVVLEARADEATSATKAIRIAWDGNWADGDAEMARHLVVKEIDRPAVYVP